MTLCKNISYRTLYNSFVESRAALDFFHLERNMTMNIALIGYGKTGKEIENVARERGHFVSSIFTRSHPLPDSHSDFFQATHIDCCIDFSVPEATKHNIETTAALHIPIVVGTTGWNFHRDEYIQIVNEHKGTLLYGSNFSIGAQVFLRIISRASRLLNAFPQYDVAIHEMHHTQKKDAPSGTALSIGKKILSNITRKTSIKLPDDSSPIQPNELMISSTRVGNILGTHSVLFNSPFDEIELIHRAHNRKSFALGAVLAAEWIQNMHGIYTVEEVIFDKLNYLENEQSNTH